MWKRIVRIFRKHKNPDHGVHSEDPQWIVNDLGELGVVTQGRFYFLYKGRSLEYGSCVDTSDNGVAIHEDGKPMRYRIVGKREFGEVCRPIHWDGNNDDRYSAPIGYIDGLTFGVPKDGEWRPLPAKPCQRNN